MNMLRENMRLIAECSQQLVSLGENLWGKGTTKEDVSFDTESEWLKHEITLPDGYIFKDENGNVINATKIVVEKKKKEYPKTYEECCEVLDIIDNRSIWHGYRSVQLKIFQKLLICRDAYWKIAGDWKPKFNSDCLTPKYIMTVDNDRLIKSWTSQKQYILAFPTEEMRDAFKENFDTDIEICKELL